MDPKHLKAILKALNMEVILLHVRWRYYEQLFRDEDSMDALNKAVPSAASILENALFSDVLLSLTRLFDSPVGPYNFKRFSLRVRKSKLGGPDVGLLADLLALIADVTARDTIQKLVDGIKSKTSSAVEWRNNKIAHNNWDTLLGKAAPLPDIRFEELGDAIKDTGEVARRLNIHLDDVDHSFNVSHFDEGKKLAGFYRYGLESWDEDRLNSDRDRFERIFRLGKYADRPTILGIPVP